MEKIQRGAFAKTIVERGNRIPVMFSHGKDPTVGLQVLGKVRDLREDAEGVSYQVELFDGLPPLLLAGLKAGSYGASFRGTLMKSHFDPRPARSEWNPSGLPESVVTELALKEFGPVATPAYADTSAQVRHSFLTETCTPRLDLPEPELPAWQLQREDFEPAWKLQRRGERRGRTICKA